MPTSTFFNLPEKKKIKLISAIKDEFSRVSFDEVSINKIIQAADIPRGSFYQYFADKKDMLNFILSEYRKQITKQIKEHLQANNGDIISMFYYILEFTIEFATEEKQNNFCKNLFADIKVNTDFYLNMSRDADKNIINELYPYVNFNILDLREEDDFNDIMSILSSICIRAITEVFLNISNRENIKRKYYNQLQILKRGLIKIKR